MSFVEGLVLIFTSLKTWIHKVVYFVVIVICLFWIDNSMGLTYHYFNQRKIEEIEKYNQIINDPATDSSTKILLTNERLAIIKKGPILVSAAKNSSQ
jgi:hypothetical protein